MGFFLVLLNNDKINFYVGSGEKRFRTSALDAPDMFLSEKLSDIKVVCFDEGKTETSFPAHRFVLSCI